jgi:ComF family protein
VEVLPRLAKFKGAVLDLLFPQKCIGCGKEGGLICESCQRSLPRIVPPVCPKCGKSQSSAIVCSACIVRKTPIDGIRSPFKFDGLMREAVHQLKYKNLRTLSHSLGSLLASYYVNYPLPGEVIVPVPLHPKRLKERGYNQSALLARELGKIINLPVDDRCLIRERFVIPQAKTKSAEERRRNVVGAFSCLDSKLRNKQVLLVDDVSTSGATLEACTIALKSAGAMSVWALVLTREL